MFELKSHIRIPTGTNRKPDIKRDIGLSFLARIRINAKIAIETDAPVYLVMQEIPANNPEKNMYFGSFLTTNLVRKKTDIEIRRDKPFSIRTSLDSYIPNGKMA